MIFSPLLCRAAVAADPYSGAVYWASEGSLANIFRIGSDTSLFSRLDQPFALEYDWAGNRLLWVEDGANVMFWFPFSPFDFNSVSLCVVVTATRPTQS